MHRIHYMMVPLLTLLTMLLYVCSKLRSLIWISSTFFPCTVCLVDIAVAQVSDAAVREHPLPLHIFVRSQRAVEHRVLLLRLFERCVCIEFHPPYWQCGDRWLTALHVHRTVGVMLFTVILLIGSGWSLMKSYLNDKEKKTILFVLVFTYVLQTYRF